MAACLHVTTETANLVHRPAGRRGRPGALRSQPALHAGRRGRRAGGRLRHPRLRHQGRGPRDLLPAHQRGPRPQAATSPWTTARDLVARARTASARTCSPDIIGGTEETTTGVIRLRAMEKDGVLEFPIVAVNDADDQAHVRQPLRHRPVHASTASSAPPTAAGRAATSWSPATAGAAAASRCGARGLGADVIVTEIDPHQGARGRDGRLPGDADGRGGARSATSSSP